MQPLQRVCVFCGSKNGDSPRFREAATAMGTALAARGLDLVYGGAQHGLMGAVADAVLAGGRQIIGVVPRGLARDEFAHPELTEHLIVDSMPARKTLMGERADAFVALPGGFGTMDELFEVLTDRQLGLHRKPVGLLDVDGYYQPLLTWLAGGLQRGFIPGSMKDVLVVRDDANALVEALLAHR
ncbi:MAG: TIGR00730 family Rossman fold protein [Myxococcota bacterium]